MKPSRERDTHAYLKTVLERDYGRRLQPFFQGTITNVSGTGPWEVEVRKTGEDQPDGNTYLSATPNYTPRLGDVVECFWRDDHTGYVLHPLSVVSTPGSAAGSWRGAAKPRVLLATGLLNGPFPISQSFTPHFPDSTILVRVSGTFYVGATGLAWVNVNLDGSLLTTGGMFFNATAVHQTVPFGDATISNLTVTSHTLQIVNGSGASSDANDRYSILVTEFPA